MTEEMSEEMKWKKVPAKLWFISVLGSLVIGLYGWITGDMSMVGMAFGYFMISSIALIPLYSLHRERVKNIELENLEERIERLEEELS